MKKYLYARISRKQQNIERQIRNLREAYPDGILVQEAYTGTRMDRKEWSKLFQRAQAGDLIVFDSVSRMSRNADEGISAYEALYRRGVDLVFLKEPYINTEVFREKTRLHLEKLSSTGSAITDKFMAAVMAALQDMAVDVAREQIRLAFEQSEKEVSDLHQRTKEGIETARLAGKQIGRAAGVRLVTRKSVTAKDIIRKHCKDFGGSLSDAETMALAGLSRNTFYKYKREMKYEASPEE